MIGSDNIYQYLHCEFTSLLRYGGLRLREVLFEGELLLHLITIIVTHSIFISLWGELIPTSHCEENLYLHLTVRRTYTYISLWGAFIPASHCENYLYPHLTVRNNYLSVYILNSQLWISPFIYLVINLTKI